MSVDTKRSTSGTTMSVDTKRSTSGTTMSVDTKRSTFHAPDHAHEGPDMLLYTSVIGYRRSMEEESLVKSIIIMPRINVFNKCDIFSVSLKACTSCHFCGISMLNCTS